MGPATDRLKMTDPLLSDPGPRRLDLVGRYRTYMPRAIQLAYLLTGGDVLAAEDIAQDAFLRVASRVVVLNSDDAFERYLRKSIVNGVAQERRRARRAAHRELRAARVLPDLQPDRVSSVDDRLYLLECLRRLSTRQRAVLVLKYWVDLPDDAIANELDCPVGTVKSAAARGIESLRRMAGA